MDSGHWAVRSIHFAIFAIIVVAGSIYGIYCVICMQITGESILVFNEKPSDMRVLFWFFSPVLVSVFAHMNVIGVTIFVSLISFPFRDAMDRYSDYVYWVTLALSFFFAFGTLIWLWKLLKNKSTNTS